MNTGDKTDFVVSIRNTPSKSRLAETMVPTFNILITGESFAKAELIYLKLVAMINDDTYNEPSKSISYLQKWFVSQIVADIGNLKPCLSTSLWHHDELIPKFDQPIFRQIMSSLKSSKD